jgi:hypothetical protein
MPSAHRLGGLICRHAADDHAADPDAFAYHALARAVICIGGHGTNHEQDRHCQADDRPAHTTERRSWIGPFERRATHLQVGGAGSRTSVYRVPACSFIASGRGGTVPPLIRSRQG